MIAAGRMTNPGKLPRSLIPAVVAIALLISVSCATPSFRVIAATPAYQLCAPNGVKTTFAETLRRFNGFDLRRDWMDLRPDMELRIENAYYQPGASRNGLRGFLGTEIALFKVQADGELRLLSVKPMKHRPKKQPSVQKLVGVAQRHYSHHRFYYELFVEGKGDARSSVLLGADSQEQIEHLAAKLRVDPNAVCGSKSVHCTIFPELCTVSIEMRILANGASKNVRWGSDLADIVDHPRSVELLRQYHGRWTPVKLDARDPGALQLPLLPGDRIHWK